MEKVLIADDDRLILEQLSELLRSFGYEASYVSKPEYVIQRVRNEDFNLLLLDVFMPGVSGLDILKEIRRDKSLEQLPVIMMTGEGDENILSECFLSGASDYIDKPINEVILRSRIDASVREVKRREELVRKNISIQEHQTELEKQKSIQYRLQSLSAQMNPHFIFNAINSIQYFVFDEDKEHIFDYLSNLSSLFRQALHNSERTYITLEEESDFLRHYLNLECMRMKGMLSYELIIDKKFDVTGVLIPPMLVQPYIENAIHHGIAPKEGKGKIHAEFIRKDDNTLLCKISDNGIGIQRSKEIKSGTNGKAHKSLGMSITNARIELLNSLNNNSCSVDVETVLDAKGNSSGTVVTITFPLISY